MKAIQRRAEDNFVPTCHRFWHPTFGQESQQVLIPKPAKSPTRMQLRQEIEDILVQKWVSHFDRRMHRDAIAFGLEEMPG